MEREECLKWKKLGERRSRRMSRRRIEPQWEEWSHQQRQTVRATSLDERCSQSKGKERKKKNNWGLCIIQQLVADAFSSHVCPGANALFILWRGIDSVSNQPRWWGLDRCCQISYRGICCGKLCNSHYS